MHENVGLQDQIAASYGGFNSIKFSKTNFRVSKINCSSKFKATLNKNLFLVYTGISRTAQKIANSYTNKLSYNKRENIKNILKIVERAKKTIKQNNCDDFGRLLHETWVEKRSLSTSVTTNKIDNLYDKGLKNGALGGKLLGAGGGGFILFYVENKKIPNFKRAFSSNILVPVNLSNKGSEVIFYEK
jgi:D-glycero-alpha-D-manno-heptose-7-phosphate kinase